MTLRALTLAGLVACGATTAGPDYRLNVRDSYEVGEDATIALEVNKTTGDSAIVLVTRPDGSTVRQKVPLDREQTQVKFGTLQIARDHVPTFTTQGDYRVELRTGNVVLAKQEIRVVVDRLTKRFGDEEIAGYVVEARYTRAKQNKTERWKTYGALYEHTMRPGVQIHVLIEEPGDFLAEAWKPYEEEGTLGVIENNNVRFRERTGSMSASWISGKRIIAMRAAELSDLERGFIAHWLARYPSSLKSR
jgi:hypothetical protein